jgi:hypothetical protein
MSRLPIDQTRRDFSYSCLPWSAAQATRPVCDSHGEVDFVVVGIGQGARERVALGEWHDHDVLGVVAGAEDGIVAVDGGLLDAGNPVDARLLAVGVDVVDERLYVRKGSGVGDGPAIAVKAALPSRVNVDVAEAVLLDPGGLEGVGLGLDIGLSEKASVNRLLAEAAPAKVRFMADAVDLGGRGCVERTEEETSGRDRKKGSHGVTSRAWGPQRGAGSPLGTVDETAPGWRRFEVKTGREVTVFSAGVGVISGAQISERVRTRFVNRKLVVHRVFQVSTM